jgi:hypothetical protein
MGEMTSAYTNLVGKLEEKIPFGRPRLAWKDDIKIILNEEGCEDGD